MRWAIAELGAGCRQDEGGTGTLPDAALPADAARFDAASGDALADTAAPGCQPKMLLTGGTDVTAQGWSVIKQGQLLLSRVAVDQPFKLELVLQVEAVNRHDQLDAGAAILGSFTPPAGNANDRAQMSYLDPAAVGWADDTQSSARAITDGAYHTYVLSVDASRRAALTVDGNVAMTRTGYATTGTIAVGDQTNDRSVDAAVRIRSVSQRCLD